jgi:hypothetical protein
MLRVSAVLALLAASLLGSGPLAAAEVGGTPAGTCAAKPASATGDVPVLAHFYIWFNASSWNRAKKDYPAVARYSSDQVSVMRTQADPARAAGIDGLIVGWRSTDTLNSRLAMLRNVAHDAGLQLALTYQAQDFNRNALPVAQVRHDLEQFADAYGDDPVFQLFGARPVVAISGTWLYSEEELRSIAAPVASRLQLLGTEKSVAGYERVAPVLQGNLYYWSSADPEETPHYRDKLQEMADAVHARCGLWVAPVSAGFDARDVGGRSVVDRRDGDTLRASWTAAAATSPDALGVISWNEYSENTHIEPSTAFGTRYLDVLGELTGVPRPEQAREPVPAQAPDGAFGRAIVTATVVLTFVLVVTVVGVRHRREQLS